VLPVSGIAAKATAYTPFRRDPRQVSATFSGSPLAMAAVRAAVEVLGEDDVVVRARAAGEVIGKALAEVADRAGDVVREARGLGVLHGVEFAHPRDANHFGAALIEHGVVPSYSMATTATVRLTPPALLDESELDHLAGAALAAADATCAWARGTG
jgi:putrescine aminotransferase